MPSTKISALTDGAPAVGTDIGVFARAGANVRLTLANILTYVANTLGSLAGGAFNITGSYAGNNAGFQLVQSGGATPRISMGLGQANVLLSSAYQYAWNNANDAASNNPDTALARKAAKVVEINNGTAGSYTGTALSTGSQTVAQLPAAGTAGAGARSFVTDATATTFMSTVAGGGANKVPVVSDGTNWLIG